MSAESPELPERPYFIFNVGIAQALPAGTYALVAATLNADYLSSQLLRADLESIRQGDGDPRKVEQRQVKNYLITRAKRSLRLGTSVVTEIAFNTSRSRERVLPGIVQLAGVVALYGTTSREVIAERAPSQGSLQKRLEIVERERRQIVRPPDEEGIHVIEVDGSSDDPREALEQILKGLEVGGEAPS